MVHEPLARFWISCSPFDICVVCPSFILVAMANHPLTSKSEVLDVGLLTPEVSHQLHASSLAVTVGFSPFHISMLLCPDVWSCIIVPPWILLRSGQVMLGFESLLVTGVPSIICSIMVRPALIVGSKTGSKLRLSIRPTIQLDFPQEVFYQI